MTTSYKHAIREWIWCMLVGFAGGMVSSSLAVGWLIYAYH